MVRSNLNVDPRCLVQGDCNGTSSGGTGAGPSNNDPNGSGDGNGGKKKASAFSKGEKEMAHCRGRHLQGLEQGELQVRAHDRMCLNQLISSCPSRDNCKFKHLCNVRIAKGKICLNRHHTAWECPTGMGTMR